MVPVDVIKLLPKSNCKQACTYLCMRNGLHGNIGRIMGVSIPCNLGRIIMV